MRKIGVTNFPALENFAHKILIYLNNNCFNRNSTKPMAPMIAAPMLVTFNVLVNSSRLGFLVMRMTRTVSFINLFSRLGGWISSVEGVGGAEGGSFMNSENKELIYKGYWVILFLSRMIAPCFQGHKKHPSFPNPLIRKFFIEKFSHELNSQLAFLSDLPLQEKTVALTENLLRFHSGND